MPPNTYAKTFPSGTDWKCSVVSMSAKNLGADEVVALVQLLDPKVCMSLVLAYNRCATGMAQIKLYTKHRICLGV